jgi:hypothetical protein
MTNTDNSPLPGVNELNLNHSMTNYYEFQLEGWLDPCWSEWLDGLEIKHIGECVTSISGPVVDQSALYGLLLKIRDLNLKLLLVKKL